MIALDDEIRIFKHDFANILSVIGGYINSNDMEGLKKYYSSLDSDFNKLQAFQNIDPKVINDPGVYNLISKKYNKAVELNIKTNIEIFFDFKNIHISIYDFSKILGIFLDNAIEAAKDSNEKLINIVFRDSKKNHVQIISIENTYFDKNIDTLQIFNKGISSKENHSGIGLWEVNRIVNKYNNTILETSKNEKFFKQELQISY